MTMSRFIGSSKLRCCITPASFFGYGLVPLQTREHNSPLSCWWFDLLFICVSRVCSLWRRHWKPSEEQGYCQGTCFGFFLLQFSRHFGVRLLGGLIIICHMLLWINLSGSKKVMTFCGMINMLAFLDSGRSISLRHVVPVPSCTAV